jgi:hypothetical protein
VDAVGLTPQYRSGSAAHSQIDVGYLSPASLLSSISSVSFSSGETLNVYPIISQSIGSIGEAKNRTKEAVALAMNAWRVGAKNPCIGLTSPSLQATLSGGHTCLQEGSLSSCARKNTVSASEAREEQLIFVEPDFLSHFSATIRFSSRTSSS